MQDCSGLRSHTEFLKRLPVSNSKGTSVAGQYSTFESDDGGEASARPGVGSEQCKKESLISTSRDEN